MIFLKILGVIAALFGVFLLFGFSQLTPEKSAMYRKLDLIESDCARMKEVAVTSYEKIAARDWCEEAKRRAEGR
jgi:hypothetical protein